METTNSVTLYYVELHGLERKVWTLCSKKDYESRKSYDSAGAKRYDYNVIRENALFQLVKVNKDKDGVSALLKVKGYMHVEWFDIYLEHGSYVVEQNRIINPTRYSKKQWDLIHELLDPLGEELELESEEDNN